MGNYRRSSNNRGFKNNRSGGRRFNSSNPRNRRNNKSKKKESEKIDRALYINSISKKETKTNYKNQFRKYSDFGFNFTLNKNLEKKGFEYATEIQDKAIPLILQGDNVLGISATGSGKTGAFLIPMIEKLIKDKREKLLIIAPTRELAQQIGKEAISFLKGSHVNMSMVIGGESINRQAESIRRGDHLIIGTPGRIKDFIETKKIKIEKYQNVVIDEVDRMLDMGFVTDIKSILEGTPEDKQILFFSATMTQRVEKIVDSLCKSYEIIRLNNNKPNENIVQSVIDFTHNEEKIDKLEDILNSEEVEKAIIFVSTKRFADKVDNLLYKKKFKVGVIHGDKKQSRRKKIIDLFRQSRINVLVGTDVAARGIDIDDITHVINLDEPQNYDEYIHRIGRTGRNGSTGTAYTFVKRN